MKNIKYFILAVVAYLIFNSIGDYLMRASNNSIYIQVVLAIIKYGAIIYIFYRALKDNNKAGNNLSSKESPFLGATLAVGAIVIFFMLVGLFLSLVI